MQDEGRALSPLAAEYVLPQLADLPIPRDVRVDRRWPEQLKEFSDHIGPYHALQIVDRLGGRQIRVPSDVTRSPFRDVLPQAIADKLSFVFAGCELEIPVARDALTFARRQPVIASVRAGKITGRCAAIILGTARTYVSELVNRTDEGIGYDPIELPEPARLTTLRNAAELAAIWLGEVGATAADIIEAKAGIIDLYFTPPKTGKHDELSRD